MILKKGLMILGIASVLFLIIPISSTITPGVYDPWVDTDDDGIINYQDLYNLAVVYGTSGTPINKTDLLLQLEGRIATLEAQVAALEAPGSVTTDKIADGAVTASKIAPGARAFSTVQGHFHFVTYKAPGVLVAAGMVMSDGTVETGINIASCSWNAVYNRYEITIGGENYFWRDYVTVVTVAGSSEGQFATTSSVMDDLLVYIWGPT